MAGTTSNNKYLKQRKGRDVWMFQIRIPKELRHLYDGKEIFVKSLETSCIKTARLRRDALLGQISKQKEQAIDGGRATFISFYNNLKAGKEAAKGNRMEAFYQLDTSDMLGTEDYPDIRSEAWKAAESGSIPLKYSYTIKESLEDWLRKNKDKNHDTRTKMKSTTNRFLRHLNKHDTPLMVIERKQVIGFIDELAQELSVSTIRSHLSRLRSLYHFAWQIAEIDKKDNPFDSHVLTHYENDSTVAKTQLFSRQQIQKILQWADTQAPQVKLLVYLGLYTGCRIGELCNVKIDDVVAEQGIMAMYIRKGKTGAAERTVPIPKVIHSLVKEYMNGVPLGEKLLGMTSKRASNIFSEFKTENITKDDTRRFHSFRVHMSTAYQRARIDESTAAFLIGHKGGKTMTYGYYAKGEELKVLCEYAEQAAAIIKRDWL